VAGKRPDLLARDLAAERARERFLAGQHAHVVEHRLRVGELLLAPNERQERRWQHGAAAPQPVRPVRDAIDLGEDLCQLDGHRLVDDDAHRALIRVVSDQKDDALREVGIVLVRGRDQQLALGGTAAGRGRHPVEGPRRQGVGSRTGQQGAGEYEGEAGASHGTSDSRHDRA